MSSKTGASLGIIKIVPFESANEFASLLCFSLSDDLEMA